MATTIIEIGVDAVQALRDRLAERSDIAPGSSLHAAIDAMLARFGLNVGAWQFRRARKSHCARQLADGTVLVVPFLNIILSRSKDVDALGIDTAKGNWDDRWTLTGKVRSALNHLLAEHGFGAEDISDHAYIFIGEAWDHLVRDALGRALKPAVSALVIDRSSQAGQRVEPKYLFWNSSGLYSVIYENCKDYDHVLPAGQMITDQVNALFVEADRDKACGSLDVAMDFLHLGMKDLDLHGLSRED
ncbi:hypothetical protein FF098_001205 [Parvularcula flava]|uniref:Uncharacterized protein n=1 Tax=Aquisalinus luteolus TaxID=1566827 RepID=A0A8J3EQ33_9PROT|nr:hypothetical protein [Aquisalinus luteolus]NHK26520.1 hypothetical protein [Aquisalinus luteolus]GGH92589.1 hypothetical protein GCM10011355_02440 [Aquisalinus luteolus]